MLAARNSRRRIDDALATVSPLALAEAVDAHICSRSVDDLHDLIARSRKRMDAGERAQLDLYLNTEGADDLLGHRFSAFLRQNPRAIASLEADAVDGILRELGDVPQRQRAQRRLSARASALLALVLAVAILPLAAQYAHQRGLLEGLAQPLALQPFAPFVERVAARTKKAPAAHRRIVRRAAVRKKRSAHAARAHVAPVHHVAQRTLPARPAAAWKFDPRKNPYVRHVRVRRPYAADASLLGERARLAVRSYLDALVAGNLPAALHHLGLRRNGDTSAISELPIIARGSSVAIVGSRLQAADHERVQADIVTAGREYYEVFDVVKDGPAVRIADRYYIPVNRRAEVAVRLFVKNRH